VSLGSVDTLIEHPAALTHRLVPEADRTASGVPANLLRVSVGLEDVEDLWADLNGAVSRVLARPSGAGIRHRSASTWLRSDGATRSRARSVGDQAGDRPSPAVGQVGPVGAVSPGTANLNMRLSIGAGFSAPE